MKSSDGRVYDVALKPTQFKKDLSFIMRYSCFSRFVLLAAVFMLPACSYFNANEDIEVTNADSIDLLRDTTQAEGDRYSEIVRNRSDGRIEVYNLDGAAASADNLGAEPARIAGGDPSVEIYSLDGGLKTVAPNFGNVQPARVPAVVETVSLQGAGDANGVVYFDHGSAALDSEDIAIIRDVAQRFNGAGKINVVGGASASSSITDPVARKLAHLRLSAKRALNVAKALVLQGVSPDVVHVSGRGEAVSGDEAGSRRVDILVQ